MWLEKREEMASYLRQIRTAIIANEGRSSAREAIVAEYGPLPEDEGTEIVSDTELTDEDFEDGTGEWRFSTAPDDPEIAAMLEHARSAALSATFSLDDIEKAASERWV